MKSGRAKFGIIQKMRIKNLRRVSEVRFRKLDSCTLKTSKNHLIRNFLRNGRLRVKSTPVATCCNLKKLIPSQILFSIWKKKSEKLQFGLGNTKIRSKESVLKKAVTKVRSKSPAGEWALESRTKNTVKKWFKFLIYIIFFKLVDNQIFFPQTNKMSLLFSAYQNFDDHEILLS